MGEQWFFREREPERVGGLARFVVGIVGARVAAGDLSDVALADLGAGIVHRDEGNFRVGRAWTWHQLGDRVAVAEEDLGGRPLAFAVDGERVIRLRVELALLDCNVFRHLGLDAASTEHRDEIAGAWF